ncbi:MAG TPA: ATP synthase F1 subunit delta [Planctomycetaceae bacterium]|nr:ATP synthase F1 subunit delta [Planctomycetaceae bacterium]
MADKPPVKTRIESVMEDPSAGAVARVYADAFLNSVPAGEVENALEEFRSFVDDVLQQQPDFKRLLTSDTVGRDQKLALIDRVVAGRGSERFTNFLRVLARHDRLNLLTLILAQCGMEHERRSGRRRVQLVTARPLPEAALGTIRERLSAVLPFQPVIEPAIDPDILGGLRIRVGDTVYDGSLRARLKQLRNRVRVRSLHEIQSGRNRFSHPERD